jgi:hypothetical protein
MANSEEMADVVEALLLSIGENAIGQSGVEELLARAGEMSETRIDLALRTMKRRQKILGDSYPFALEDFAIRRNEDWHRLAYSSLLTMSPSGLFRRLMSIEEIRSAAIQFEGVVQLAVKDFLGPSAQSIRFGWPSESGRPSDFPGAISWLAKQMGVKLGGCYRQPRRQDGGVDVIAWRSFKDGKSGFPIVLVQCTIQAELLAKSLDIDIRNWSSWLELVHDPVTVLASPQVVPANSEDWNELALKNMIFDRLRLLELLSIESESALSRDLEMWLTSMVNKLADRLEE